MKKDVLLVTLNSTYQHAAFGLRYLFANMKEYQDQTEILEFTTARETREIAESILAHSPRIVGFGVYIWNVRAMQELVSLIKRLSPETLVILGGPEVSHESEGQSICQTADYVIKGEADFLFYEFCRNYFVQGLLPANKFIVGALPEVKQMASPYRFYSDEDIKNRILYVEASRGCPYKCEYCLSSLDKSVRSFDLEVFLQEMDVLIQRGARSFKFIDRTFNLSIPTCTRILQFFLERIHLNLFLHFEMVPDRLPEEIRGLISRFPEGALQFEIGIQTWNPEVAKLVSRRNDFVKVRENFKFLHEASGVHTHADLIVGLPGESIESFAKGFDELVALQPNEIQVGILKRLKGTPIVRHDREWQMVYQEHAPFQILSTRNVDFLMMQKMNRFAKYWDLFANSGQFKNFVNLLKDFATQREDASFFWEFFGFSEFMSRRHSQSYGISLLSLVESAWIYLSEQKQFDKAQSRNLLMQDYCSLKKRDVPRFLREDYVAPVATSKEVQQNKRQQRHLDSAKLSVSQ